MNKKIICLYLVIFALNTNIFSINLSEVLETRVFNDRVELIRDMKFSDEEGFDEALLRTLYELNDFLEEDVCGGLPDDDAFRLYFCNKKEIFPNIAREHSFSYAKRLIVSKNTTIYSMGDIHGSIYHLVMGLRYLYKNKVIDRELNVLGNNVIAFTGDYIDRGSSGLEVLFLIISLFNKNRDKVLLLRGNHETYETSGIYGFLLETFSAFEDIELSSSQSFGLGLGDIDFGFKIFERIAENTTFTDSMFFKTINILKRLPVMGFVISRNKIVQFVHGSVQPGVNFGEFLTVLDFDVDLFPIYDSLTIDSQNPMLWADCFPDQCNFSDSHGLFIKFSNLSQYLINRGINILIAGHSHYKLGVNEFGVYEKPFENGTKFIRHIQNFGLDPDRGIYNGSCMYDTRKHFYRPSWLETRMNEIEDLDEDLIGDIGDESDYLEISGGISASPSIVPEDFVDIDEDLDLGGIDEFEAGFDRLEEVEGLEDDGVWYDFDPEVVLR